MSLIRVLTATASAAALVGLLTVSARGVPPARAATINVPCNTSDLINAVTFANNEVGFPGPDTLELAAGCTYTLTAAQGSEAGLPPITSIITINGNGSTITRSATTTEHFRILVVSPTGGSLSLNDATITGGDLGTPIGLPHGGGIMAFGPLTVTNSTISGNRAGGGKNSASDRGGDGGYGGGIYFNSAGPVSITDSTVSNNVAGNGGSGGPGFIDGFGGQAGGVFLGSPGNSASTKVIGNSTISGNTAGSGVAGQAFAGGLEISLNAAQVTNVTVSGNSASSGGGIVSNFAVLSKNSLVAGNTGGNCVGAAVTIGSTNNMASDNTCGSTFTQKTPAEINLGPLADNGGPSQTMALILPSAAIDVGDSATCAAAPVNGLDQRGALRPLDGDGTAGAICDIGAFETCPAVADCDDDGYTDTAEASIGTKPFYPCGIGGWPSNVFEPLPPAPPTNKLDIQDVISFVTPVRHLDTSPGPGSNYSARWDLTPGPTFPFTTHINILDITTLLNATTGNPPMFSSTRAFGKTCPLPP